MYEIGGARARRCGVGRRQRNGANGGRVDGRANRQARRLPWCFRSWERLRCDGRFGRRGFCLNKVASGRRGSARLHGFRPDRCFDERRASDRGRAFCLGKGPGDGHGSARLRGFGRNACLANRRGRRLLHRSFPSHDSSRYRHCGRLLRARYRRRASPNLIFSGRHRGLRPRFHARTHGCRDRLRRRSVGFGHNKVGVRRCGARGIHGDRNCVRCTVDTHWHWDRHRKQRRHIGRCRGARRLCDRDILFRPCGGC